MKRTLIPGSQGPSSYYNQSHYIRIKPLAVGSNFMIVSRFENGLMTGWTPSGKLHVVHFDSAESGSWVQSKLNRAQLELRNPERARGISLQKNGNSRRFQKLICLNLFKSKN